MMNLSSYIFRIITISSIAVSLSGCGGVTTTPQISIGNTLGGPNTPVVDFAFLVNRTKSDASAQILAQVGSTSNKNFIVALVPLAKYTSGPNKDKFIRLNTDGTEITDINSDTYRKGYYQALKKDRTKPISDKVNSYYYSDVNGNLNNYPSASNKEFSIAGKIDAKTLQYFPPQEIVGDQIIDTTALEDIGMYISSDDTSLLSQAKVLRVHLNVNVVVDPSSVSMVANTSAAPNLNTQIFTPSVPGDLTNQGVSWSLTKDQDTSKTELIVSGKPTPFNISNTTFTAPTADTSHTDNGKYTLTATSILQHDKSAVVHIQLKGANISGGPAPGSGSTTDPPGISLN